MLRPYRVTGKVVSLKTNFSLGSFLAEPKEQHGQKMYRNQHSYSPPIMDNNYRYDQGEYGPPYPPPHRGPPGPGYNGYRPEFHPRGMFRPPSPSYDYHGRPSTPWDVRPHRGPPPFEYDNLYNDERYNNGQEDNFNYYGRMPGHGPPFRPENGHMGPRRPPPPPPHLQGRMNQHPGEERPRPLMELEIHQPFMSDTNVKVSHVDTINL